MICCESKRDEGEARRGDDASGGQQDLRRSLLVACQAGDDQAVRNLMGAKADVNARQAVLPCAQRRFSPVLPWSTAMPSPQASHGAWLASGPLLSMVPNKGFYAALAATLAGATSWYPV